MSAVVLTYLNVIISALTIPLLFILARNVYNEKIAWLAAWAFCFWPTAYWRSFNLWSETLAAFLFLIILIVLVSWLKKPGTRRSLILGLMCGLGMLTTAAFMTFIIFSLILVMVLLRPYTKKIWIQWAVILVTMLFTISPWLIRNYMVFHKVVPIRSTSVIEFTFGNIGSPDGTAKNSYGPHPYTGYERELYHKLGEIPYTNVKAAQFKTWLIQNPVQFIKLSLLRVYWFWFGDPINNFGIVKKIIHIIPTLLLLGWLWSIRWRRRTGPEYLLLLLFLVYPLPYYLTSVTSRYRFLMEPALFIVGMYTLEQLYMASRRRFKFIGK